MPTLASLRAWADTWLPDDPDMVERDPDILLSWLGRRVDSERLPERPVVLELRLRHRHDKRYWLVLQRGADAYGCLTDPLPGRRPLRLPRLLHAGAPGDRQGQELLSDALQDGSVLGSGDPDLLSHLPSWFVSAADPVAASKAATRRRSA